MKYLLLSCLVGCAPMLHRAAQVTELGAQGSLACDWSSTNHAVGRGYMETNPIMGEHPDTTTTGMYFVGVASAVAMYNRVLPDYARVIANTLLIGVEVDAALSNHSVAGADPKGCGL